MVFLWKKTYSSIHYKVACGPRQILNFFQNCLSVLADCIISRSVFHSTLPLNVGEFNLRTSLFLYLVVGRDPLFYDCYLHCFDDPISRSNSNFPKRWLTEKPWNSQNKGRGVIHCLLIWNQRIRDWMTETSIIVSNNALVGNVQDSYYYYFYYYYLNILQTVAHLVELVCRGPSVYKIKAKILQKSIDFSNNLN